MSLRATIGRGRSQCEPLSVNWWSEMYTRIPFGKYSAEADSDAVPVRVRVAVGAPALHILEVAEEEKADLIALSTHGRSGFSRWAFGSVAEQVLRNASCPLLVKRTAGFLEDAGAEPAGAPAANAEPPS